MEYTYFDYKKAFAVLQKFSEEEGNLFRDDEDKTLHGYYKIRLSTFENGDDICLEPRAFPRNFFLIEASFYLGDNFLFAFEMGENMCCINNSGYLESLSAEDFKEGDYEALRNFIPNYVEAEDWREVLKVFIEKIVFISVNRMKLSEE